MRKSPLLVFGTLGKHHLVIGASFQLRSSHVVDGLVPGGIPPPLIVQQVPEIDPAVGADHVEWDFAVFNEPHQEGTSDAEYVGRSLCGDLLMYRHD
jgi:hypothetical protein